MYLKFFKNYYFERWIACKNDKMENVENKYKKEDIRRISYSLC